MNINSWSDLALCARRCAEERWIFRGESSCGNELKPKAGRVGTGKSAPRKKPHDVSDERAALDLFKRQARPYLTHSPASDIEWLAIAQHHGMSTRLLDWTESILAAAFFAVDAAGTRGDAVIFGVKGLRTITRADEKRPFSVKTPGIYRPPHIAPRIPAQRSVFTIHPDPAAAFAPEGLSQWVISSAACGEIKRVLDACGINESSLFPDLDGLSRYIGWRYKWGKF
jgi:hypothetical protein